MPQIYGVNLTGINLLGSIPDVNSTVDFFGSTAGIRFLGAIANLSGTEGLNATGVAIVADAPAQLNQTYAVRAGVNFYVLPDIRTRPVLAWREQCLRYLPPAATPLARDKRRRCCVTGNAEYLQHNVAHTPSLMACAGAQKAPPPIGSLYLLHFQASCFRPILMVVWLPSAGF